MRSRPFHWPLRGCPVLYNSDLPWGHESINVLTNLRSLIMSGCMHVQEPRIWSYGYRVHIQDSCFKASSCCTCTTPRKSCLNKTTVQQLRAHKHLGDMDDEWPLILKKVAYKTRPRFDREPLTGQVIIYICI
jgi:hypothetical protein